jgi:hypothetical protein
MVCPHSFDLLQQEAHLVHSCFGYGLTALRRARVDQKGDFYSAFFQLSIGLERLMKINLIIAHMANHSFAAPTTSELKSFGHDLLSLFEACKKIAVPNTSNSLKIISRETIEYEILSFLSAFAKSTRYFNLDGLSASHLSSDPLKCWNSIIERLLNEDVSDRQQDRVFRQCASLGSALRASTVVVYSDLERNPMDIDAMLLLPRLHELAAPHAVYRVICIIRALAAQSDEVSRFAHDVAHHQHHHAEPVPHMGDFFHYAWHDRKDILRKSKWP